MESGLLVLALSPVSTKSIRFAIAVFPLELPANSNPTGFLLGSVTNREPESPGLMNDLLAAFTMI